MGETGGCAKLRNGGLIVILCTQYNARYSGFL